MVSHFQNKEKTHLNYFFQIFQRFTKLQLFPYVYLFKIQKREFSNRFLLHTNYIYIRLSYNTHTYNNLKLDQFSG